MLGLIFTLVNPTEARSTGVIRLNSETVTVSQLISAYNVTSDPDEVLRISTEAGITSLSLVLDQDLQLGSLETGNNINTFNIEGSSKLTINKYLGVTNNLCIKSGEVSVDSTNSTYDDAVYAGSIRVEGGRLHAKSKPSGIAVRARNGIDVNRSWIKTPANSTVSRVTIQGDGDWDFIADANGVKATEVLIEKPASSGKNSRSSGDSKKDEDHTPPSWELNPNEKQQLVITCGGLAGGTCVGYQEQGDVAKAAIKGAMPAGFVEAFEFNILNSRRQPEMTLKQGTITLSIPNEYRKAGRQFCLIALTEGGRTILLPDGDKDPDTITVNVNHTGYAFSLIYKD